MGRGGGGGWTSCCSHLFSFLPLLEHDLLAAPVVALHDAGAVKAAVVRPH